MVGWGCHLLRQQAALGRHTLTHDPHPRLPPPPSSPSIPQEINETTHKILVRGPMAAAPAWSVPAPPAPPPRGCRHTAAPLVPLLSIAPHCCDAAPGWCCCHALFVLSHTQDEVYVVQAQLVEVQTTLQRMEVRMGWPLLHGHAGVFMLSGHHGCCRMRPPATARSCSRQHAEDGVALPG